MGVSDHARMSTRRAIGSTTAGGGARALACRADCLVIRAAAIQLSGVRGPLAPARERHRVSRSTAPIVLNRNYWPFARIRIARSQPVVTINKMADLSTGRCFGDDWHPQTTSTA